MEIELRHKLEEINVLLEKQVPLQARIDLLIDDDSNFTSPSCATQLGQLHHVCQGAAKSCNRLCFLRKEPREQLAHYEAKLRGVIARLGELRRDISALEWRRGWVDRSMRDGLCPSRARHEVRDFFSGVLLESNVLEPAEQSDIVTSIEDPVRGSSLKECIDLASKGILAAREERRRLRDDEQALCADDIDSVADLHSAEARLKGIIQDQLCLTESDFLLRER